MIDLTKNHHLRAHQNHQKYEFYSYTHRQFFWIIVAVIAAFLKRLQNQKPVFVIQALKLQTHALIADYSFLNPIYSPLFHNVALIIPLILFVASGWLLPQ